MFLGTDRSGPRGRGAAAVGTLGPLERRVLEALRNHPGGATVNDLCPALPAVAYTTLSTTVERLRRKGLLERRKWGRAYAYHHRYTPEELASLLVNDALSGLGVVRQSGALPPVLSMFLDAVSASDEAALDELERVIRERRRAARSGGSQR